MPHKELHKDPDVFFRTQYIVFGAMLVGPIVVLLLFTAFVPPDPAALDTHRGMIVTYLALFAAMLAVLFGFLMHRGRVRNSSHEKLHDKLATYSTANLIRWASLEAAMLFSALAFGITGMPANLVLFATLFLIYLFTAPGRRRFSELFHLTLDQKDRVWHGKSRQNW